MTSYKILIIGCSGSGKSTLAREMAKYLNIPVLHLDRIFHATNFDQEDKQTFQQIQLDFINENDNFIIDGDYLGTMDCRMPYANFIIWFRIPRRVSICRVILRSIKVKLGLEKRTDIAEEFRDKFGREYFEFLKYVWNFKKVKTPMMEAILEKRSADCKLVVIKNKKDKEKLLNELVR